MKLNLPPKLQLRRNGFNRVHIDANYRKNNKIFPLNKGDYFPATVVFKSKTVVFTQIPIYYIASLILMGCTYNKIKDFFKLEVHYLNMSVLNFLKYLYLFGNIYCLKLIQFDVIS